MIHIYQASSAWLFISSLYAVIPDFDLGIFIIFVSFYLQIYRIDASILNKYLWLAKKRDDTPP
jgi:hypothetical protein